MCVCLLESSSRGVLASTRPSENKPPPPVSTSRTCGVKLGCTYTFVCKRAFVFVCIHAGKLTRKHARPRAPSPGRAAELLHNLKPDVLKAEWGGQRSEEQTTRTRKDECGATSPSELSRLRLRFLSARFGRSNAAEVTLRRPWSDKE